MTNPILTASDLKTSAIGDGKFDYSIADQTAQVRKNAAGTWDLHYRGEINLNFTRKQDAKEAGIAAMLAFLNKQEEEPLIQAQAEAQTAMVSEESPNHSGVGEGDSSDTQKQRRKAPISIVSIAVDPNTMENHEEEPGKFTISVMTSSGSKFVSKRIYNTVTQVKNASKRYFAHWNNNGGISPKKWVAVQA